MRSTSKFFLIVSGSVAARARRWIRWVWLRIVTTVSNQLNREHREADTAARLSILGHGTTVCVQLEVPAHFRHVGASIPAQRDKKFTKILEIGLGNRITAAYDAVRLPGTSNAELTFAW